MAKRKTSYMLLSIASSATVLPACGGPPDTSVGNTGLTQQHCDGGFCAPEGAGGVSSTGPCGGHVCGVVVMPPGTGGTPAPCNGGPCGVVVQPPGSGGGGGISGSGGTAGGGPCGGHVCGVVVTPPGTGGAPAPCNGGPCGVIVHPPATGGASGSGGAAGTGGMPFPGLIINPSAGGTHG